MSGVVAVGHRGRVTTQPISDPSLSTRLGQTPADRRAAAAFFVAGGAALGVGLTFALDWLLSLSWIPWRALFSVLESWTDDLGPWAWAVFGLGGAVVGVVAGIVNDAEEPTVDIGADRITVIRDRKHRHYRAADVREVLYEDGALVLLAHGGTELARTKVSLDVDALAEAARRYGYTWTPTAGEHR